MPFAENKDTGNFNVYKPPNISKPPIPDCVRLGLFALISTSLGLLIFIKLLLCLSLDVVKV